MQGASLDRKGHNERFQQLVAQARAQHLARISAPVGTPMPPSRILGQRRKPANDARRGELPL